MKYLEWHLGLGDAIAFADLAVRIADDKPMVVPCKGTNLVSVQSIFANHPNILVLPIDGKIDAAADFEAVRLGHYSGIPRNDGEDMIEWMYRTAGRNHHERFEEGVVDKAAARVAQLGEWMIGVVNPANPPSFSSSYRFIHHDKGRGFRMQRIDGNKWTCEPMIGSCSDRSILSWANLLRKAAWVDCIDSSFLHLAEALEVTGELQYHKYARPGSESYNCLRHAWTVLE